MNQIQNIQYPNYFGEKNSRKKKIKSKMSNIQINLEKKLEKKKTKSKMSNIQNILENIM